MNTIRNNFPFFAKNPEVIYFDSASTSQNPQGVIDAIHEYLSSDCANAGRGSYRIANKVTKKIEDVRAKVKEFIHANCVEEVIFTSGATASLNTVVYAWGLHNLQHGDEILVCFEDHDSNVLPWIQLKKLLASNNINITIIPFKNTSAGDANIEDIINKVTNRTRLIALTHIHNVYGVKSDIEILRQKLDNDILLSLDAAQSIGHIPVDVQALGVEFLSFSGHKMFASTGIGVLWINKRLHTEIHPFLIGGGTKENLPNLLEAGTANIAGIISLGEAIDFITTIGIENIHNRLMILSQYLLNRLRTLEGITFLPGIAFCQCAVGYGTIAFNIGGIPSHEAGFILNEKNIFVRTGTHCTGQGEPMNDSIRVSLHIYNTESEIDRFIDVLQDMVP